MIMSFWIALILTVKCNKEYSCWVLFDRLLYDCLSHFNRKWLQPVLPIEVNNNWRDDSECKLVFPFWALLIYPLKINGVSQLQFSSVQSLSHVWLFVTPWIAAHQASLSIINPRSSLRLTCIKSVMPSSHLILCPPALNPSQHQSLFQWVNSSHEVAKVLEFQL